MIKAADPEGKGINFIINHGNDDSGRIDPSTGLPAAYPAYPFFATNVVIRLTPPLRDVTVRQAIDVIARVAETPLSYSVEDYAVVFTPSPPTALHTRWFRIDANTFSRALSDALTTNMDRRLRKRAARRQGLVDSPLPGKARQISVKPSGSELLNEARRLFTRAGVDFTVPGKSLVFSERLGQMVVRATLQDLAIIDQNILLLNTPPPQLTIEVKVRRDHRVRLEGHRFRLVPPKHPETNSGLGPDQIVRDIGDKGRRAGPLRAQPAALNRQIFLTSFKNLCRRTNH